MNRALASLALFVTVAAVILPIRHQTFARVALADTSLRLLIAGRGDVAVVFENGLGPPLEMWGKVQPQVNDFARTVAYDRAGVGLSTVGSSPRDGRRIAAELHQALNAAGVAPPYLLVGASMGGLCVRVFAGMYPGEVKGVVLVDPTLDTAEGSQTSDLPELVALTQTALQAKASAIPSGVPLALIDALSPLTVPFATAAIEQLREKQRAGIGAESAAYEEWLATVSGARLIVTRDSGHNVPIEQPDLVVETIRQMVELISPISPRRRTIRGE